MERLERKVKEKNRVHKCEAARRRREKPKLQQMLQKLRERNKQISELKQELRHLNMKLKNSKFPLRFKHGKKYDTRIRAVYQDLLQKYSVSTGNCEGVVRTVLEGLADVRVGELPKRTAASAMFLEGRTMAQIQVAQSLAEADSMTLSSDGTSKFGHHYSAYDIYAGNESLTIGLRESAEGTAQTTLNTFLDILTQLSNTSSSNQSVNEILAKIKNTISDRHAAQKKFNTLLKDYRQDILPDIIEGWDQMSDKEKTDFSNMNHFFCALHYLVGLANYASRTLKAWESMIFGDRKVGAAVLGDVETKSESGTERLVRTVCKAVKERGCQESGKPVEFKTFLRSKGIHSVPLAPFKGNRFNILFYNSAGVAHLEELLKEFFDKTKDYNLLMRGVHADLAVDQYIAGVRALGLIDKLVTGPLWRKINEKGHITDMNDQYQRLHKSFSSWSDDCDEFMQGKDNTFSEDFINKDAVYHSLIHPTTPEITAMMKQVLELIFLSFCQVTERMLGDHLESGVHAEMKEGTVQQTESVPRTNVGVERDFGMLDRIMRLKPSATVNVYESVIMSVRNKTSEWRKGLPARQREEFMEFARKSVQDQRREYAHRVKTLWAQREEKRKSKKGIQSDDVQDHNEAQYNAMIAPQESLAKYRMEVQQKRDKQRQCSTGKSGESPQIRYSSLVGKIVEHKTTLTGKDNEEGWFRAIIIARMRNGMRVSYDREPDTMYELSKQEIQEDLENGNLKLVKLTVEDIAGMHIMHHFKNDGEWVWLKGFISSVTNEDMCLVEYDLMEDEEGDMESSWEGPILCHYWRDDVRFIRHK